MLGLTLIQYSEVFLKLFMETYISRSDSLFKLGLAPIQYSEGSFQPFNGNLCCEFGLNFPISSPYGFILAFRAVFARDRILDLFRKNIQNLKPFH